MGPALCFLPFWTGQHVMRIHRTGLHQDASGYGMELEPSYTMLEFDSLRPLPEETGTFHPETERWTDRQTDK